MTPEERAEALVGITRMSEPGWQGTYVTVGGIKCGVVRSVREIREDAEQVKAAIQTAIEEAVAFAVADAMLVRGQLAYQFGLPLTEGQETTMLDNINRILEAAYEQKLLESWKTKNIKISELVTQLYDQMEGYRGLIATMSRDNGYMEGYEAGLKKGRESGDV